MGTVLKFPTKSALKKASQKLPCFSHKKSKCQDLLPSKADLLFFTGVRYERLGKLDKAK